MNWRAPRHVRARAPLRLGLAGGGSDIRAYAERHGGAVLNVSIDRFAFAHLSVGSDGQVRLRAADLNREERHSTAHPLAISDGLRIHRAVYERLVRDYLGGERPSLSITTTIDAPMGSGLGSSSALCVALITAFAGAFDLPLGPYDVARLAYDVERNDLGLAGGMQDQYAAAFGGLNFIEFRSDGGVIVNPLRTKLQDLRELESSLVVCFTGQSRDSAEIIEDQITAIETLDDGALSRLHDLKQDAFDMKLAVLRGDIEQVSRVLNRSWQIKRGLSAKISNTHIERIYQAGMNTGAKAGKISGAGGGGFMMFMTDPENRFALIQALNAAGGTASPVFFTAEGAEAWPTRS